MITKPTLLTVRPDDLRVLYKNLLDKGYKQILSSEEYNALDRVEEKLRSEEMVK